LKKVEITKIKRITLNLRMKLQNLTAAIRFALYD